MQHSGTRLLRGNEGARRTSLRDSQAERAARRRRRDAGRGNRVRAAARASHLGAVCGGGGGITVAQRMMPARSQSLTWQKVLVGNVAARIGALCCVFAATLLLAHDGGAAVVGVYALFHVLPGLVGTI